jgi:hypothetical protein
VDDALDSIAGLEESTVTLGTQLGNLTSEVGRLASQPKAKE